MVLFTPNECEQIKSYYHSGTILSPSDSSGYQSGDIKFSKSSCTYVNSYDSALINLILKNTNVIGIKSLVGVKILKYGVGDSLPQHRDHMKYDAALIHKTCMIQLSDSSEYEGGDLVVGGKLQSRAQGNICTINPTDLHGVTEVTKGERYSAVLFLHDGDIEINKTLI